MSTSFDATPFKGKMPWGERYELIKEHFPEAAAVDWKTVFQQDPSVMGKFLGDIFKADLAEPGRPGKRPSLEKSVAFDKYRKLGDNDYSFSPFPKALAALKGVKSLRHFSRNLDLPKSTVDRLLKGDKQPDIETIEQVAKALGKDPSYFVEYRIGYIVASVSHFLEWAPEASVVQYNKIKGREESVGN